MWLVKHIQTWGKELKEYLIFFLTSLGNQNYSACLEKYLLPEFSGRNFTMACKVPMKHQVFQYLNTLQINHSSVSLCNFLSIILKHGKLYPQVSQPWEQHWQRGSSDKENKSASLRNNYYFEAWKRKQDHHPSVPLVSQVEAKYGV